MTFLLTWVLQSSDKLKIPVDAPITIRDGPCKHISRQKAALLRRDGLDTDGLTASRLQLNTDALEMRAASSVLYRRRQVHWQYPVCWVVRHHLPEETL